MNGASSDTVRRPGFASHLDLWVIGFWTALVFCIAVARANFNGDGVRHLLPILAGSKPLLGEARWIFFPALLFAIIKPLQIAGIVNSISDAAHVFLGLDFVAGVIYLLLIRRWLIARSVPVRARAGALLIAGMTVPLLHFASDIVEPMVPATIAVAGLTYLASRPPVKLNAGMWVAAGAIAVATLLYQGIVLAIALVACAIPRGAQVRARTVVVACAILATAPLAIVTTLVASGDGLRSAVHLIWTGEENVLFRERMATHRLPEWQRPVAAITLGAARSIVEIPDNQGFGGSLRALAHRATFAAAALALSGCLFALVLVAIGAVRIARRRDWRMALAFAGIMVLPAVRGYAYLKYYVLFPVLVSLAAAVSPPTLVSGAGAIVGAFNVEYLTRDVARDRKLARDLAPLYAAAGTFACWLTTSWSTPTYEWPGSICSMSEILTDAHTDKIDAMIAENNQTMLDSFRRCFCEASAVYTDDVTVSSRDAVIEMATYYRFSGADLNNLLWNERRGTVAFDQDGIRVFKYSRGAQMDVCSSIKTAHSAAVSH